MQKQNLFSWGAIVGAFLCANIANAQEVTTISSGDSISGLPEYYVVQNGDTLWDISQKFLGDPYYWPRLWSINSHITNPHWIYPGNRIVFKMGSSVEPIGIDVETTRDGFSIAPVEFSNTNPECGPDIQFNQPRDSAIYLAPAFMAQSQDVEVYGTVEASPSARTYLSEGDRLYLRVDDPDAFECGDVVSVFHVDQKRVRHPNSRRIQYGNIYQVAAEASIVHKSSGYLEAVIRQSWSEVERGALVGPQMPVAIQIDVPTPQGDLEGTVVARVNDDQALANTREVVFIDRGRADGVRVGDAFYLVQSMDEHVSLFEEDERLPTAVTGRIVIIRVDERSSTAIVTDSNRSVRVGARLAMDLE